MFVGYKNIWKASNVLPGAPVNFVKISDNLAGSNSSDMAVVEHSSADSNILFIARSDNKLFRSDNCLDASPSWTDLTGYLPASVTATSIATHPTNPNTVYMTAGTKVYKSINKGNSWTDISGSLPAVHISSIVCYKNANEGLYIGTDAGVYYSDKFTGGWISFSEGLPANGRITELEIYYDNDSVSQDVIKASSYGRGLWGSDMYHAPVTADFSASHTLIPTGCNVNFTDQSAGVPDYWKWTFQGGIPSSSTDRNPAGISYSTPGNYTVKLKCWNVFSQDSVTKTNYITVSGSLLPAVNFTASKQSLCVGDTVKFTDLTDNCPNAWAWTFTPDAVTFVNGTTNNDANPVVLFNNLGPYDVKLSAANNNGQSSLTRPSYILNGGYGTPFMENFSGGLDLHYWTVVNPDADFTWDTITVPGVTGNGKAAWMNMYNYTSVNKRDQLISPPLRMPAWLPLELTFRHAYAQRVPIKDSLIIKISEDCGLTWTRIWAMGPDGTPLKFVTAAPINDAFVPQSSLDWCSGAYGVSCYSINLENYIGKDNVKIMFESFNRNGNNLYLTDITIQGEVGISDQVLDLDGVRIYPNPSHGLFTLECSQCKEAQEMTIVSGEGIEVFRKNIPESSHSMKETFDLSRLAKGVYILHLKGNNSTRVGKLVIN